jgi:hypothetical protein
MIDGRKIGQFLLGEYDKTSQPLLERSSILPFGQYEDGSVGLAWPEILAAPAEGIANFGQYGYGEDAVPYNSRMAFDAAGGAMTGGLGVGLAGGMVDNAVGSAGGKLTGNALERAQPPGIRAYHWSKEPDAVQDGGRFHQGTHFGTAQQANDRFALEGRGQGGATFPVDLRMSNPLEIGDTASGAMGPAYEAAQKFGLSPDDAQSLFSRVFREGYGPLDEILSQHGFDGLKYTNAVEGPGQTSYIATHPGTVYSATTGDLLYSNAPPGSSVPLALNALERAQPQMAKGTRPEPDALIPKAVAMGADFAPQGVSSGSIAETAPISLAEYLDQVKRMVDDGQDGPFFGPRSGASDDTLAAAYENAFRRELDNRSGRFDDWQYSDDGMDAATAYGDRASSDYAPYVAAGLEAAAKAAGRELSMFGASSGSQYGELLTPAGNKYKVRVADHSRTSSQYANPDFNIAPGAWTPDDFLAALPTIYANAPTSAAIPASMEASDTDPALLEYLKLYGL